MPALAGVIESILPGGVGGVEMDLIDESHFYLGLGDARTLFLSEYIVETLKIRNNSCLSWFGLRYLILRTEIILVYIEIYSRSFTFLATVGCRS